MANRQSRAGSLPNCAGNLHRRSATNIAGDKNAVDIGLEMMVTNNEPLLV